MLWPGMNVTGCGSYTYKGWRCITQMIANGIHSVNGFSSVFRRQLLQLQIVLQIVMSCSLFDIIWCFISSSKERLERPMHNERWIDWSHLLHQLACIESSTLRVDGSEELIHLNSERELIGSIGSCFNKTDLHIFVGPRPPLKYHFPSRSNVFRFFS